MDSFETFRWEQLARRQKIYIGAAVVLVVIIVGGLAWDSLKLRGEINGYETRAVEAERQKDEALTKAANVASELRKREVEQNKTEGKRDAKADEVKRASVDVDRDRVEYERAKRAHRTEVPSAEQLCADLAAVGHPCQPT